MAKEDVNENQPNDEVVSSSEVAKPQAEPSIDTSVPLEDAAAELPEQQNTPAPTEQAVAPEPAPGDAKPAKPKKSRKKLLITLLILLILGGLTAVVLFVWPGFLKDDDTPAAPTATAPEPDAEPTRFIYAYTDQPNIVVRQITLSDKKKSDIGEYENFGEALDAESKKSAVFNVNQGTGVDLSNDNKTLAITTTGGLITQAPQKDAPQTTLISTKANRTAIGNNYELEPQVKKQSGSPGDIYSLLYPEWSVDNEAISFLAGHFEGSSGYAIRVSDKKYANATDTFRYIEEKALGDKFSLIKANQELKDYGVLPELLFDPTDYLQNAVYSADKSKVYAVLCPEDKPTTGDSRYVADAVQSFKGRKDCGEPAKKTLIEVDTTTGEFSTLVASDLDLNSLELKDGTLYTTGTADNDFAVVTYDLSSKQTNTTDVLTVAKVDKKDVEGVVVNTNDFPVAVIYHKDGNLFKVTAIDINNQKVIATLEVDKWAAFKPLGLVR